jgi:hypothetical protein
VIIGSSAQFPSSPGLVVVVEGAMVVVGSRLVVVCAVAVVVVDS